MQFEVDGQTVYAHTGGKKFDPQGNVVVMVHGAAMSHLAWSLQTRYLAHHGMSVLSLDLPGCGKSGGDLPDSIPAAAEWLVRVLDTLGIARAALVGHSMGALIALQVAGTQPDRISRLVLMGVGYPMAVNDAFLNAADENLPLAIGLMNDWAHGRRAHIGGYQVPGLWMVGADTRVVQQAAAGVMHRHLAICNAYDGGEAAAAAVTCPTHLILGANDNMTPAKVGQKLARMVKGAETTVIPECGHMMMSEQPTAVMRALKPALGI
ncbi:MAG: alpha/beta hydrolase [Minwuia sp.]|nr:alpha/beta hydrolase [Minwuia sp.]